MDVDTWPRRRTRRQRRTSQADGSGAGGDDAGGGAASSSGAGGGRAYDFEFRPSRQNSADVAGPWGGILRRRSNSYERISSSAPPGRPGPRSARDYCYADVAPPLIVARRGSFAPPTAADGTVISINPVAVAAGESLTRLLTAVGPATICGVFGVAYLVATGISLVAAVAVAAVGGDVAGGFAVATYVLVVCVCAVVPAQARHLLLCRCTPEARDRAQVAEEAVSATQYARGLRVIRERIEGLNQEVQALRLQWGPEKGGRERGETEVGSDGETEGRRPSILRRSSTFTAMSDSEDERRQRKLTSPVRAQQSIRGREEKDGEDTQVLGSGALVRRSDSDNKDGFEDLSDEVANKEMENGTGREVK